MKIERADLAATRAARDEATNAGSVSTTSSSPAQDTHHPLLGDGIHLAAIWRGPRDRSRAIQFSLRAFNGTEFLDIRQYQSSSGYMIPTTKGLTISIEKLGEFAAASGAAYRRACKLGLITQRSSS